MSTSDRRTIYTKLDEDFGDGDGPNGVFPDNPINVDIISWGKFLIRSPPFSQFEGCRGAKAPLPKIL